MFVKAGLIATFLIALAAPALAQQARDGAADGAAVFKRACANCHAENQTSAPTPATLRQMKPEEIFNALTLGRMQIQAISLSEAEQRAVAVFASGKPFGPVVPPVVVRSGSGARRSLCRSWISGAVTNRRAAADLFIRWPRCAVGFLMLIAGSRRPGVGDLGA